MKTDRGAIKTLSIITASIILISSYTVNAGSTEVADKKAAAKKTESIESILADKDRIQGKVAKRIRTYHIDTWRRLDNYHIFIEGKGKNNDYLIKFTNKCYGTRNGSTLIYKTNNNELTKFDSIGILDSFISSHDTLRPRHSCSIDNIYHLENLVTEESAIIEENDNAAHKVTNK